MRAGSVCGSRPAGRPVWPGSAPVAASPLTGSRQVGAAPVPGGYDHRAVVWSGTAASVVYPGGSSSDAYGVCGGDQVGHSHSNLRDFAALWHGSTASEVSLHSPAVIETWAFGINGSHQAGRGSTVGGFRALAWSGSAGSAIDLHAFLPAGCTGSMALSIGADGTIEGYAVDAAGAQRPVVWEPGGATRCVTNLAIAGSGWSVGQAATPSAALTRSTDGASVAGETVRFLLEGADLGNATTNASGVARMTHDLTPDLGSTWRKAGAEYAGSGACTTSSATAAACT